MWDDDMIPQWEQTLWLSFLPHCSGLIVYWHRQHQLSNNHFVTQRCGAMLFDISAQVLFLFHTTGLNLPSQSGLFCTRVSFHFISWFIYMTDALMHAVESLGVHCSWTPPAVWVCYLNPWSRVPFLPFSWTLAADPGWQTLTHTGTVKIENPLEFTCLLFFPQIVCSYVIVYVGLCVSDVSLVILMYK